MDRVCRMPPGHRRAMRDIESCRTEAMGGHVYLCPHYDRKQYSYHSCKNRHCPKCQQNAAQEWLERQQELRLPVPYFLLTFTLPEGLRRVARRNQKTIYNLLFRASAAATQQLALDSRFVGGRIGMIGVLHTWARGVGIPGRWGGPGASPQRTRDFAARDCYASFLILFTCFSLKHRIYYAYTYS